MNWIKSKLIQLVLRHTLNGAGAWFITKGFVSNDDMEKLYGALAVLFAVSHSIWDKRADIIAELQKLKGGSVSVLFLLAIPCLLFTGCTLDKPHGKILSVTTRGFMLSVAATDSTTGTPKIQLGLGSQTVLILPTDTNLVYTANFANSAILSQTINPFSTSGTEAIAAGNYQINQTNNTSAAQPIVPK